MAYIGTVSIVDDQGDALVTRRYAAPASDDPAQLVAKMTASIATTSSSGSGPLWS